MQEINYELNSLTNALMKEVSTYGILEVSLRQYRTVGNKIIEFAVSLGQASYSQDLMEKFCGHIDIQVRKEVCAPNTTVSKKESFVCWNPWLKQEKLISPMPNCPCENILSRKGYWRWWKTSLIQMVSRKLQNQT